MSEERRDNPMEQRLRKAAQETRYPPTPDIAGEVRRHLAAQRTRGGAAAGGRRFQLALAALLVLLLVGVLSVPEVRANILRLFRIGSVEVTIETPTPDQAATAESPVPADERRPPSPTPLRSVLDLAGETTLQHAREQLPFTVRLPAYPPGLGAPDRVYLQDLIGAAVILVWTDPEDPRQVRLALHQLSSDALLRKGAGYSQVTETTIGSQPALWVQGEHFVQVTPGDDFGLRRLVPGNTLIWSDAAGVTYRLESDLPLAEARRIAESLQEIDP